MLLIFFLNISHCCLETIIHRTLCFSGKLLSLKQRNITGEIDNPQNSIDVVYSLIFLTVGIFKYPSAFQKKMKTVFGTYKNIISIKKIYENSVIIVENNIRKAFKM